MMRFRANRPFRRNRRGRIEVNLSPTERQLLGGMVAELRELLGTDDASLRRLFPTAYPDDPTRDAEYQILARSELLDRRLGALEEIESSLEAESLEEDQALAWMQGLNQMRLVLGTRLDVDEDDAGEDIDPDDPEAPAWMTYRYLSVLLGELVDAMSG